MASDLRYITGVCWYFFMKSEDFVAQVGVVFLLYLLFHCQREQRYAIPVNVEILEKVHVVRKRCMSEQILLEFPAALRYLVQEQALSVGLRASYRNLFFDKYGHLLERKALASAHGRGRAERGATHETPLPDTRAWHRMKAKEMLGERDVQVTRAAQRRGSAGRRWRLRKPVEVHIPAPPDVSHLEAQLKSYEDLRDGASGAGEVDRSLSQRMKRLAEASAVFEKSVPVPTEDLEHEAKAPVPKQRRLKRRRVFEDSEDEVEVPKAVPVMELRQEGPPGEEAFRQVRVTSPELQNSRVLGLDAAVQQGTADQLLKQTFARPSRASADQAKAETMPEEKEELPELQPIKLPDPPAAPPERTDRPAFDVTSGLFRRNALAMRSPRGQKAGDAAKRKEVVMLFGHLEQAASAGEGRLAYELYLRLLEADPNFTTPALDPTMPWKACQVLENQAEMRTQWPLYRGIGESAGSRRMSSSNRVSQTNRRSMTDGDCMRSAMQLNEAIFGKLLQVANKAAALSEEDMLRHWHQVHGHDPSKGDPYLVLALNDLQKLRPRLEVFHRRSGFFFPGD
eukprot:g14773.t1